MRRARSITGGRRCASTPQQERCAVGQGQGEGFKTLISLCCAGACIDGRGSGKRRWRKKGFHQFGYFQSSNYKAIFPYLVANVCVPGWCFGSNDQECEYNVHYRIRILLYVVYRASTKQVSVTILSRFRLRF